MSAPVIGITGYADRSDRPPNVATFASARTYVWAVASNGGAPVILPPYVDRALAGSIFDTISGLILSGGGDIHPLHFGDEDQGLLWRVDRRRDETELALAQWALAEGLPTLAICRGHQVLNVAAGGTLIQDIPTNTPKALAHSGVTGRPVSDVAHEVIIERDTRLASLLGAGSVGVNSAHHQAVKGVGEHLVVAARAPDGVVESLEAPGHRFCVGVQWHPEVMIQDVPRMNRLFAGLVEAALG